MKKELVLVNDTLSKVLQRYFLEEDVEDILAFLKDEYKEDLLFNEKFELSVNSYDSIRDYNKCVDYLKELIAKIESYKNIYFAVNLKFKVKYVNFTLLYITKFEGVNELYITFIRPVV